MDRDIQDARLTSTQLEVLARHASGRTIKRVALDLNYSHAHVNSLVQGMKKQLHGRTLAACVMRAHAMGLLSHPTGPDATVFPLDRD